MVDIGMVVVDNNSSQGHAHCKGHVGTLVGLEMTYQILGLLIHY